MIWACVMLGALSLATAEVEIVSSEIPPYVYMKDGKVAGVAAELVQAMAPYVGHSGRISLYPWKRAQHLALHAREGAPRLILPLNRSPEREAQYQWVTPLIDDETRIITRAPGVVDSIEQGMQLRIGVLAGSPLEVQLGKLGFKRIDPGMDEGTNAKKLGLGRLDAWFVAAMVAPFVYRQMGYDPAELRYGKALDLNDLYLGATKALPEAEQGKWRDALKKIRADGTYKRIVDTYLPKSKT